MVSYYNYHTRISRSRFFKLRSSGSALPAARDMVRGEGKCHIGGGPINVMICRGDMAQEGKNVHVSPSSLAGPKSSGKRSLFYPKTFMVPRNQFTSAAAAFTGYILGGILLLTNRHVSAFFVLSFALTVHIFDAYSFPFLNRLSGQKESLLFGGAVRDGETGIPSSILFLSPSPAFPAGKRKRSLYRIGFLGGVTLFLTSVAGLVKITVPHLIPAAGAALSAAGFFSRGMHETEKNRSIPTPSTFSAVSERLMDDGQFGSWIILLTDQWPQTMSFLARYREFILSSPCIFLGFDANLPEKECTVDRSLAILTGYRTHPGLTDGLVRIAGSNGLAVTTRKSGLALSCLCALARGYRAASITFSSRIDEAVLHRSLDQIIGLQ